MESVLDIRHVTCASSFWNSPSSQIGRATTELRVNENAHRYRRVLGCVGRYCFTAKATADEHSFFLRERRSFSESSLLERMALSLSLTHTHTKSLALVRPFAPPQGLRRGVGVDDGLLHLGRAHVNCQRVSRVGIFPLDFQEKSGCRLVSGRIGRSRELERV